jgi:transposase
MHIVLLSSDGYYTTHIARVLFRSCTTVYAIVVRFVGEGQAAFDYRQRRGPRPLLDDPANEWIERLVEEDSPTEHGWLRSCWRCSLLVVHLLKERTLLLSTETVRRILRHLNFRWCRPRPVPTGG